MRIDARTDAMRTVLRLAELRAAQRKTQTEMADLMRVTQANVSRIEKTDNPHLTTLAEYVGALGGRLEINAVFPDEVVHLGGVAERDETPA